MLQRHSCELPQPYGVCLVRRCQHICTTRWCKSLLVCLSAHGVLAHRNKLASVSRFKTTHAFLETGFWPIEGNSGLEQKLLWEPSHKWSACLFSRMVGMTSVLDSVRFPQDPPVIGGQVASGCGFAALPSVPQSLPALFRMLIKLGDW